jgi:hypothetical protein
MKKVFLGLFLILSFSQYSNGDAGFFGSPFGGYVIYDLNGGGLVVSRNWGSSIGTNPSSLSLKGGIIHTYKNNNYGGGNICGGTLYYRVWTGTQSGSFNSISLTFAANHSFNTTHTQGTDYSGGTGDQKWEQIHQQLIYYPWLRQMELGPLKCILKQPVNLTTIVDVAKRTPITTVEVIIP